MTSCHSFMSWPPRCKTWLRDKTWNNVAKMW